MPIYEYRCESCQHELETIQKISDPPLRDCPSCGELALKKKISAAGFRLKGSGWYETDFKTSGQKKNLAKDDAPAAESKKADTKAGEGKTKTETTASTSAKPVAAA
jgi:putative FmdB family regulatory protein